ncbi:extensin-like [Oncorhynchus mykiss]|uniref:ZP domain-containing protein n=1 Tax=Oncorhynchus mykiss TaxID=8022 RepID=A0A8C7UEN4_ONCMY|nr:extensin-like [Oncorhynchus mykiss]
MRKTIRDVMSCKHPILYLTVMATISSVLTPCYGQIPDASISMPNAKIHPTIVRSGRLVVGNKLVQLRRVGFEVTNDESAASDRIKTKNGSLAFEADNRAGQPASQEWHKLDAKLQHMGPSVQCSNETMTLRVKGGRAPHFLVDGGDGSPVLPLSRMPTHCGFSVKRSRRHVFFVAPYQGCHVTQEGGNYVLPLRLWGAPMTMSCPVAPPPPPSVSCYLSGMVVKLSMAANALQVKVSGVWEPLLAITQQCGLTIETFFGGVVITAPYTGPCVELEDDKRLLFMLSGAGELTLSCPAGLPPTEPVMSGYPLFYQLSQYHFPPYPPQPPSSPTAATTMSKQTHSPKPSSQAMHMPRKGDPQVPQTPEFHLFYPYHFPPYPPQRYFPTSAPTTSPKHTQSPQPVTQVLHMPPKADPQVPQTPEFHPFHPYHFLPYPPQQRYFPTSAPTTSPKHTQSPQPVTQVLHMPPKADPQVPQTPEFHPFHPYHFPPYPPQQRYFPTSAPTTSPKHTQSPQPVTQVLHMPPKADPQVPQTPEFHPFHPYHFPPYPPQRYFPTSAPTTSPKHTNSPPPATQALHMPPKGYPQVPQMPDFKMFYPYHFTTHLPQPYFPSASTTTPKQTNQALHMPPKGYPQVPLSYQFPQYNFPGFFPQRSVPRAPPIASQLDNQNNPQKYHYSDSSYRQSATPSVTASTIPGTTPQAQPMQPFMQYDQYPMVRSWNPYASPVFPPHYGTVPYHYQGPRE